MHKHPVGDVSDFAFLDNTYFMTSSSALEPSHWLHEHGDALYRFALSRVRTEAIAEDLVQDTLLAAMQAVNTFNRQSTVRSWLVGILKYKIIDYYRQSQREVSLGGAELGSAELGSAESGDDLMAYQFDEQGHWQVNLIDWETPERHFDNQAFWAVFHRCQSRLPEVMARLFMLRLDGIATEECCRILGFTTANQLWTALSRARMKLRQCLDTHWFEQGETRC